MTVLYSTPDIEDARQFEGSLPPGDYFVTATLAAPLTCSAEDIRDRLEEGGIIVRRVQVVGDKLQVFYHRPSVEEGVGFPWALVVPLVVPLATVALITFGIIKIEDISKALVPLIAVTGGIIILLFSLAPETTKEAIRKI